MKKEYKTPMLSIIKVDSESTMVNASINDGDWGQSKKGFFDEDEEDNLKGNDLWDDSKDNLWE